jgi:hypothetical protein
MHFGFFVVDTGILQMVMLSLVIVGAVCVGKGSPQIGLPVVGCGICCIGIPVAVINILMWVAVFESDKECGPALWKFAVFTIAFAVLQVVSNCSARLINRDTY